MNTDHCKHLIWTGLRSEVGNPAQLGQCPWCEVERKDDEIWRLRGEAEVADEQLAQLRGFAEAHKTCVARDELSLSKAQAKRILQDWIEDNVHVATMREIPDLYAAYLALCEVANR
jgi:hypothetical protein